MPTLTMLIPIQMKIILMTIVVIIMSMTIKSTIMEVKNIM